MANLSIKKTEERERRIRRLMEATGERTQAGALDAAAKHYLQDLANKERAISDLPDELVEELSTPWLPLERTVEHRVGKEDP